MGRKSRPKLRGQGNGESSGEEGKNAYSRVVKEMRIRMRRGEAGKEKALFLISCH